MDSIESRRASQLQTLLLPHLVESRVVRARLALRVKSFQRYWFARLACSLGRKHRSVIGPSPAPHTTPSSSRTNSLGRMSIHSSHFHSFRIPRRVYPLRSLSCPPKTRSLPATMHDSISPPQELLCQRFYCSSVRAGEGPMITTSSEWGFYNHRP